MVKVCLELSREFGICVIIFVVKNIGVDLLMIWLIFKMIEVKIFGIVFGKISWWMV